MGCSFCMVYLFENRLIKSYSLISSKLVKPPLNGIHSSNVLLVDTEISNIIVAWGRELAGVGIVSWRFLGGNTGQISSGSQQQQQVTPSSTSGSTGGTGSVNGSGSISSGSEFQIDVWDSKLEHQTIKGHISVRIQLLKLWPNCPCIEELSNTGFRVFPAQKQHLKLMSDGVDWKNVV